MIGRVLGRAAVLTVALAAVTVPTAQAATSLGSRADRPAAAAVNCTVSAFGPFRVVYPEQVVVTGSGDIRCDQGVSRLTMRTELYRNGVPVKTNEHTAQGRWRLRAVEELASARQSRAVHKR